MSQCTFTLGFVRDAIDNLADVFTFQCADEEGHDGPHHCECEFPDVVIGLADGDFCRPANAFLAWADADA